MMLQNYYKQLHNATLRNQLAQKYIIMSCAKQRTKKLKKRTDKT